MTGAHSEAVTGGLVEVFDDQQVTGWVEDAAAAGPVRVSLQVNGVEVAGTWAVDPAPRTGIGAVRSFRLGLRDLWSYVRTSDQISVHADGRRLPIAAHGTFVQPPTDGGESLDRLEQLLAGGHVFNGKGVLQLSKTVDVEWQKAVLELQARIGEALRDLNGADVFLIYGTLLGAVRDAAFIGHDLEFDCAYVSSRTDGAEVAAELQEIAFTLIDRGFRVHASPAALHIADESSSGARVNLFHLYFDDADVLQMPFGAAGTSQLRRSEWAGTEELEFSGSRVQVPVAAEAVLAHIYGDDWRVPNPGFAWPTERADAEQGGLLQAGAVETIYWADFYAHTSFSSGSTFFQLVEARSELPRTVIDIGCGDGRDSFAFARAGRAVTGLDRSHIGVRLAAKKAGDTGLADRLRFAACDVGNADMLREVLTEGRRSATEPVLFYARFFLHSIPEDVQRTLMSVVNECAQPGDYFAAEFRTDRDAVISKVHGDHYRRFQNGQAFGRELQDAYGFVPVLEQEGNGFSPYKGEDPQLYRVIAQR
jgi:methyltransferase family protein